MEIDHKIQNYCEKKEEEKALKKEISRLSDDIKQYLVDSKDDSAVGDEWEVRLQHKVSESMDTEKLIGVLVSYCGEGKENPYIEYLPSINFDALESAIYSNKIPEDILMKIDSCRIKKETSALVYSKKKES